VGTFQADVRRDRIEARLVGPLSPAEFDNAIRRTETLSRCSSATIDLVDARYIDSFEALVIEAILDRAASCRLRCSGHVREALELMLRGRPGVSFDSPGR